MNKYSEMNDGSLVQLTLLGEDRAYEELVIRHEKSVLGTAYKVTRNTYSAEDAAQDAFVCAWMHLNSLRRPERFCSWVCTIAKNHARDLVVHYRQCAPDISLDLALLADPDSGEDSETDRLLARIDGSKQLRDDALRDAIETLSEGVRRVILLHYFEDMSVAAIAEKLQIPEGTVKWRLSEGRKRLRKEYGVMEKTQNENESLAHRVMYQVEKFKLWQLRTDKSGFEEEYRAVLALAEKLDDGEEKSHAMADILLRGYWWLPDGQNDELLERIKLSAEAGHNDDVMQVWAEERYCKFWNVNAQIKCINDEIIPYLTEKSFPKSLGQVRCRLASLYMDKGMCDEAEEALNAALSTLTVENAYYHQARSMLSVIDSYRDVIAMPNTALSGFTGCKTLRCIDGILYDWQYGHQWFNRGNTNMFAHTASIVPTDTVNNIVLDPGLGVGEQLNGIGSGRYASCLSMLYKESGVTVETPAGTFENCSVFEYRDKRESGWNTKYEYTFCPGIGVVRLVSTYGDKTVCTDLLSSYSVKGEGLFPLETGNRWSYVADPDESNGIIFEYEHTCEVAYTDGDKTYFTENAVTLKNGYTDTWLGNIVSARLDYCIEDEKGERTCDVSDRYSRAIELAETPRQLTHAKVAANVAKRIYDTDFERKDDSIEARPLNGLWNFFDIYRLKCEGDDIIATEDGFYDFQWKCPGIGGRNGHFILNNRLLNIIGFALGKNKFWSDEWVSGYHAEGEWTEYDYSKVHWKLDVSEAGTVETAAGKFGGCLCVAIWSDIGVGLKYMAGCKEYYYAPGVGIVKYVTHFSEDGEPEEALPYELTEYRGTGEGFFPIEDGMFRHYEAIGIGQGCTASLELSYSVEGDNDIVIFSDATGLQQRDWKAPEGEENK